MKDTYILAVDQGTSSTKAIVFDEKLEIVAQASRPLNSAFLEGGLVEQDPQEIFQSVMGAVEDCLQKFRLEGHDVSDLKVCGLTNQRETFVIWDEQGNPLHPAVVWQCKRSVSICNRLEQQGLNPMIRSKTGLIIDPYFSGTKLIWLYENMAEVRQAVDGGKAYFGTIDTWILFKLTDGTYLTDYTNACRTLFFNLKSLSWDQELLKTFGLEKLNLAEPRPSSSYFGKSDFNGLLPAPVTIGAMIGDSHAAAVGEGCFSPGTAKATMGTGSSILMNVGGDPSPAEHGLVSTICWSMEGRVDYAIEGVIVSCGSIIEWFKNQLGLFAFSKDTEQLAQEVPNNGGVYLVPAFSGLGAPYWQMDRKASIHGLTFDSTKGHVVRAALESITFQVKDIISMIEQDAGIPLKKLMLNGGLIANNFLLQQTADLLGKNLGIKGIPDVTAQGAAALAGLQAGIFANPDHLQSLMTAASEIHPDVENTRIAEDYQLWRACIVDKG